MDVEGNKKKNAEVGVNHFSNDKRKVGKCIGF